MLCAGAVCSEERRLPVRQGPLLPLHLPFPLGGQCTGRQGDGLRPQHTAVPIRGKSAWRAEDSARAGRPSRAAVPVRWTVRGEARPRAEAGSRRQTEGVAETRSIFVFRSVGGASIIKFTST